MPRPRLKARYRVVLRAQSREIGHSDLIIHWSLVIGHWPFSTIGHSDLVIHWSLVIGHWSFSMLLRCRQFEFTFPRPALIMGVINVTPDSFSDGGQFLEPSAAVAQAMRLIDEGADVIDIGGESTRPKAIPVSEKEELRRVLPGIENLANRIKTPISIDTMKPGVARAALNAGASIVNDVAANREDPEMWRVVGEAGAGYVLMHMQGS